MVLLLSAFGCERNGQDCPDSKAERSCVVISHGGRDVSRTDAAALPSADEDADAHESSDATRSTFARDSGHGDADADTQGASGPTRTILVGDLVNARDLGGMPLRNGARLAYDQLFRGPPLNLTSEGCDAFATLGVRTIIDLRIDAEREDVPDARCATKPARVVLAPLPVPNDVSPADYLADLHERTSVAAAFAVLADDASYPIYFHCTWGRDRTGVLAAVILLALGAARDDIMQEYLLSNQTVGAYPESLDAVFDDIEHRGGIESYLSSIGVTTSALATLRAPPRVEAAIP